MIKNLKGQVEYYTFEILAPYPELRHAVMSRHGPGGQDWTFSYRDEVDPELINANIDLAVKALGIKTPIQVGQVHGAQALILAPQETYLPKKPEDVWVGFDAIISAFGHSLMIKVADCQGLIVYDPTSSALALVHSGWRGSVQNVIGRTVKTMAKTFKLNPKNFLACCAPSLGPCHAEFINYQTELPQAFWEFRDEKNLFDFTAISRKQLTASGLKDDNIEFSGVCTRCSEDFYSYRRGDSGRFAIIAGLATGSGQSDADEIGGAIGAGGAP
ncbi:MAG: polyphenol oxidase family protein [Deltaproteobacteria bacterium]|nr:polyphenol oxidase family protein [Deltaproteobacteria bacterium]